MPTLEPAPKRSKFSLDKCPRPSANGRLPDFGKLTSEAPALAPPETVRKIIGDAKHFIGIDVETHDLVPAGNPMWEVGEFGFPARASDDTLRYLRVLQLGWARSQDGAQAKIVKTLLIKPEDFVVREQATKKHGIAHDYALTHGVPVKEALLELFADVSDAVEQGCRVTAHHCGFDAGIIGREMERAGLAECKASWDAMIRKNGLCTMDHSTQHKA